MVNRGVLQSRRNSLMALSCVRGFDEYATVESARFTGDTLRGLCQVLRFYKRCERLMIELHHSQTEMYDDVPRLQQWRDILHKIVNDFFRQVKGMSRCNSFVALVCRNNRDLLDSKSPWEWITDDDMIIFEKCYNLTATYLSQVTDEGLSCLTSIAILRIHYSRHVTGESVKTLHLDHRLRILELLGFKDDNSYSQDIIAFLRSRHRQLYFKFHLF